MKTDTPAACSPKPRPTNSRTSRCLPFCGLGAEAYVQERGARCGSLEMDRQAPDADEMTGNASKP